MVTLEAWLKNHDLIKWQVIPIIHIWIVAMLILEKVRSWDALWITKYTLWFSSDQLRLSDYKTTVGRSFKIKKLFFSQKAKSLKAKKEEGNTAFKAGNLDEAYKLYRLDDQLNWSGISNEDIF